MNCTNFSSLCTKRNLLLSKNLYEQQILLLGINHKWWAFNEVCTSTQKSSMEKNVKWVYKNFKFKLKMIFPEPVSIRQSDYHLPEKSTASLKMREKYITKFAWKTMKHEIYECAFLMPLPTAVADFFGFCYNFCCYCCCCLMHIISRDENHIAKICKFLCICTFKVWMIIFLETFEDLPLVWLEILNNQNPPATRQII